MNSILVRLFVGVAAFAIGVAGAWLYSGGSSWGTNDWPYSDCSMPVSEQDARLMDIEGVYTAILLDVRLRGQIKDNTPFVVEEMTNGSPIDDGRTSVDEVLNTGLPVAPEAIASYRLNNAESTSLRPVIGWQSDVMMYTDKDAAELTRLVKGKTRSIDWDKFAGRYRGSQQKYTFSNIGFNAKRDQALVYLNTECPADGRCYEGQIITLEKKGFGWRVVRMIPLWIQT